MKTIELFQWDLNRSIEVPSGSKAHFASVGSLQALVVMEQGGKASVPNILLQEPKDINVWIVRDGATTDSGKIRITSRPVPSDYVYTETDVETVETLTQAMVAAIESEIAHAEAQIAAAKAQADEATQTANQAITQAQETHKIAEADIAENRQLRETLKAEEAKRATAETNRKAEETKRVEAEAARKSAEATRAAHESKRTETFNTNLVSWNSKVDAACKKATDTASKAAQDAKTATDAAIAKTEEATQAAVAKAQTATDNATTAANKAEAAVSKLPLPLGNTLKGEVESTMVNVHDAFPAPLVETKVMGHSNQITTTGKNLLGGTRRVNGYNIRGFKNILKPNTQYTYSCSGITDGKAAFRHLAFNAQQSKEIGLTVGYIKNASETFTTPENIGEFEELYLGGNYNDAGKNCINNFFQIEEGAKATSYEPYTGGKPSPSPEYPQEITNLNKAEIVTVGKNLFSAQIDISSGNTNEPIYLSKGTYTISVKNEVEWWKKTANNNNVYIHTFKENEFLTGVAFQNLVVGQRSYGTFNVNKNCEARFFTYGSWNNNAVTEIQLEAASTATTYEPHQSKSTPIDLQGNELCSLPNGIKDEVVIDAEGNVSLIKRTWSVSKRIGDMNNTEAFPGWKFTDNELKDYVGNGVDVEIHGRSTHFKRFFANTLGPTSGGAIYTVENKQSELIAKYPEEVVTFIGERKVPQTIPLGKVELPALPEATSNVWNDGNIPANVYVQYLKDVNIAYTDLENQIKQITAALSVMDTPTVIPEMAWGTPAAI